MGLKSFKSVEQDKFAPIPMGMTAARAVGGAALGVHVGLHGVDPASFYTGAALAATDAEGNVISFFSRFPRMQQRLRIIATRIGRLSDPVADVIFTSSVIGGDMAAGIVPHWQGIGIFVTTAATAGATAIHKKRIDTEPEVSPIGKVGLVARCTTGALDMAIPAFAEHSQLGHNILASGGDVVGAAAIALGTASCAIIYRGSNETPQPKDLIA
jgi:hypothetical protein